MRFARNSAIRICGVASLLFITVSCNPNLAVATFAASTKQLSELIPRVGTVRFNACVELALYEELGTNAPTLPKRDVAIASCHEQAETRDRFIREFSVLPAYFTVLGQLAAGDHAAAIASAKAVGATAGALAGANSAASGLAGAIAGAVLKAQTAAALKEAIGAADPHVQAFSLLFQERLEPAFLAALKDQERELAALYADSLRATPTNRLILYREYNSELSAISASRDLVGRYTVLMSAIAAAHARLYANRANLHGRESLAEILHDAASIGRQLAALSSAAK